MTPVVEIMPVLGVGRFPPEEFADRLANTRRLMSERGYDVLLVASPENIYYLTGLNHQGHFAFTLLVLPADGRPLVVARGMEAATLSMQVPQCEHVAFSDGETPVAAVVRALGRVAAPGDQVAVESGSMHLPVGVWDAVREQTVHLRYVEDGGLVAGLRMIKSPAEIACVRASAAASSRAMNAGIAAVHGGASPNEIAADIYAELLRAGSEYPAFAPFIRTRAELLCEHVTSTGNGQVPPGDQVFLELSASVARYHAPLTRMVYLGDPPPGTDRAAEIAVDGLLAVREALRPGATAKEVYAAWEEVVHAATGNPDYHRHHCGYMVGLGFPPGWMGAVTSLRAGSDLEIRPGMTFHVLSWLFGQEPADYVLSDTMLVGETGTEILTTSHPGPLVVADLAA